MKRLFVFLFLIPICLFGAPRFLHISFHEGCLSEFDNLADELGFTVENLIVPQLSPAEYDGKTSDVTEKYFITEQRAQDIWDKNRKLFEQYDGIITSDVGPLCRIFLQQNFKKPLLIWCCNRFDINVNPAKHPDYPDQTYYDLFQEAQSRPNVAIIGYTDYEKVHAENCGITSIQTIIEPIGFHPKYFYRQVIKSVPRHVDKPNTFFVRDYYNERWFHLNRLLKQANIPVYCGAYAGPNDLADFKGFIHIPCVMSNFHLFENLHNGIVHFIPTKEFFSYLYENKRLRFIFWYHKDRQQRPTLQDVFNYCEWYNPKHKDLFVFFDSWEDLSAKIQKTDFETKRKNILAFAKNHKKEKLQQWKQVFESLGFHL